MRPYYRTRLSPHSIFIPFCYQAIFHEPATTLRDHTSSQHRFDVVEPLMLSAVHPHLILAERASTLFTLCGDVEDRGVIHDAIRDLKYLRSSHLFFDEALAAPAVNERPMYGIGIE